MADNIPPIKLLGGYIPSIPPSLTPLAWRHVYGVARYLKTTLLEIIASLRIKEFWISVIVWRCHR